MVEKYGEQISKLDFKMLIKDDTLLIMLLDSF